MSTPVLTFFNNKGGVGKTSLIYHLAWMFSRLGKRVVVVDADPQATLTSTLLDENKIEALWEKQYAGSTIYQCVKALTDEGDIAEPILQRITPELYLLPGDIELSAFEDTLSAAWRSSLGDKNPYRPMQILSSFWRVLQMAADQVRADIILVDSGPNLGAINRSVLIATDYVAIPLGTDLPSLMSLKSLGPTLRNWKSSWHERVANWNARGENSSLIDFKPPDRHMQPIGYMRQQLNMYLGRPVSIVDRWSQRIPAAYREFILNEPALAETRDEEEDDLNCLATIKHYRSLIHIAHERRKPIFNLTSADGAIGSHFGAVQDAKKDFTQLAEKIAERIDLEI
ncbi:AAA family ATPase [Massilia sp. CCM 9210]|uniref:ParA family protein n=1 Tax=Massilia scottii TaxID=3057166 RepID=UPI0027966BC6|nr:AAA family ATPase [Massilia sp. CCM 9210]MDQ1814152.1 AAA family ATPase [Massilia sp. CCM 9210]